MDQDGREVGLYPGHILLDGDAAPLSKKGTEPPIFGAFQLWPNGWMQQYATSYGEGLGPGHIVLDGDAAPPQKRDIDPNFQPISIVAKRLCASRCYLVWW